MTQTFPDPAEFPKEIIDKFIKDFKIDDQFKIEQLKEDLHDLPFEVETYRARGFITDKTAAIRYLKPIVNQCNNILAKLEATKETGELKITRETITPINAQILWEFAREVSPKGPGQSIDDGEAHDIFQEHVRAISNLGSKTQLAIAALEREKAKGKGGDRNTGDRALDETLKLLLVYYMDATGNKVGTSYDAFKDEVNGPLVRFLKPCLEVVGWKLSAIAIRSRVRKLPPDNPTLVLMTKV